jgi:Zn-dependent protease with chaperone function
MQSIRLRPAWNNVIFLGVKPTGKRIGALCAVLVASLFLIPLSTVASVPSVDFHTPLQAAMNQDAGSGSQSGTATASAQQTVTSYTLAPDLYRKAHNLGRIAFWGQILVFFYSVGLLLIMMKWRLGPRFRDFSELVFSSPILQGIVFGPVFLAALGILSIPPDIAEHWVSRKFGLSIQGWDSWLADWAKGQMVTILIGTILICILYLVIRKSPRRWWLYFWLVSLPIGLFLVFLQPLLIDPLFHKFEPLSEEDPPLTVALEQMIQRAGENIPPERIFWMGAAEKSTALNAYVTGIGSSKRVVVWDTTIQKMTTPQIVFVAGHEMGHYVLHHVAKGLAAAAAFLFVLFYLGYRSIGEVLARWGGVWKIRSMDDWASLPALLLLLTIFSFVANPINSAVSRYFEHQADQYGLEVTHALTPDSGQIAAQSFQVLGETDLSDPDPNPLDLFLFYDHPTTSDRIRFALTYNPWANGGSGEFVH